MLEEILRTKGIQMGIVLDDQKVTQFRKYYELLIEWNQRMNLTAITDEEDAAYKHFLDSISILSIITMPLEASIIDVGTGAGFPGIPLKIVRPDLHVVLLDSLHKRTLFLKELTNILSLRQVGILHGRAEDTSHQAEHREKYDMVFSRAVAEMNVLLELCLPFVKVGGTFIAYKGPGIFIEIENSGKALELLGGKCEDIHPIEIPGRNYQHYVTIIRKVKHTPTAYPRKAGTPEKKPIL